MNTAPLPPLNPAYREALFCFEPPAGGLPAAFTVVTACNPDGKGISDEENARRTECFRKDLVKLGYAHFPVTGYDADSDWEEAGFGVVCDWQAGYWMGRTFSQDAVFRVEDGEVSLVDCRPGGNPEPEALRAWAEMAG